MSAVVRVKPTAWQWTLLILAPPMITGAVYWTGRFIGFAVAVWQVWLLVFAVFAAFIAMAALRGTVGRLYRRAPTVEPTMDSRPFAQAVKWENRLGWSESDVERFNTTVRERLVPIVAERLRLEHRVDWHANPERARALLPEPLYRLLTEAVAAPLNQSEMDEIVRQIESLFSEDRVNAEHH